MVPVNGLAVSWNSPVEVCKEGDFLAVCYCSEEVWKWNLPSPQITESTDLKFPLGAILMTGKLATTTKIV